MRSSISPTPLRRWAKAIKRALPEGGALADATWRRRHQGIRILLVAHALGLTTFAIVQGFPVLHSVGEGSLVAATAVLAGWARLGRKARSGIATFGAVTSSALLVHVSGGMIEAHFHFFVMIAVISLYQDWSPFLLALGFVVLHHGTIGVLHAEAVYNHPSGMARPWVWAVIHGAFVLAASVASMVAWRLNEHADGELKRTLSLLAATLESTADGILVVDNEGKITSVNGKFAEMWAIPEPVLASRDDEQAIAFVLKQLKDPDGFLRKVRELYGRPEAESHDVIEFIDGRTFERYSKPQRVGGRAVGRVWSFRDITERVRLDAMKNSFLSAVSHELRTPLTAVLGYALTLQRAQSHMTPDAHADMVDRIAACSLKLQRLMNDTLDLDRLSRGILEPRRTPTDLGALVRRVVEESGLELGRVFTVDADPTILDVDPGKVERIVENLLTNAARHTDPASNIWVRVHGEAEGVTVSVDDDGRGVPDDLKEAIFESFKQGPTVVAHAPGVGIGLALVARFAELHGGRAWVEDRPGGGASFRVFLPGSPKEAPALRPGSATSAA